MAINPTRKQLTLSPEAAAAIVLPLSSVDYTIVDAAGRYFGSIDVAYTANNADAEIAAFIAALVNELLTPAPAPLCDYDDCDQAALPGGDFCATHAAEHAENMAACEQVEPETTTELAQQVTAAM